MAEKKTNEVLISDSGLITANKKKRITIFVLTCRIMSVVLAVLGILAFIEGNF